MKKIIFVLALFAVFGYLASVAQADVWQAPPANPPNSNRPAPIDQSALSQTKAGALTVQGGLTAGGGGQFQVTSVGVLNMGTTANFQLINVAAGLDATNVMQGNAVYGHSSGHGLYGESSGNAYAGVYGINTGTGWAGYFQGPTGLSSYLVVGGAAQAGYSGVGDAYFYDDVGLAGDLIVSGTVRGNFVDQNGLACAQGQILKKDVVGLWTCQDDSGSLWTDMPGAGETRYMYANEAGAIKIYGNDSENTGFPNRLVIGDGTNEALDQLCLQGIAGGQCISNWADVQGTSYWIDAGAYIRPAATANFQITESNGELQVINANVVINGGHLDLENYGLIRYSSENQTPPVLIADQLMVGRKYCDAAGAFCDPPAQELGVDLANNENLIFGRVRANPTGNTNQNLLRLQQGDGDDVTIDMFKVDLQGDVYARGNVGIGANSPTEKLEVSGAVMVTGQRFQSPANDSVIIEVNNGRGQINTFGDIPLDLNSSLVYVSGQIQIAGGTPGANKVLTSNDASGLASWVTPAGGLPGGTLGQTLRHDGSNWAANSVIYNDGNYIGIGTTNPTVKLHVNGAIKTGGATIGNNGNTILDGYLEVGGAYGSTGVTISSDGNISANGNITVDGILANPNNFFIDGDGNVQIRIDKNNNGANYFDITNGANVTVLRVNESGGLIFEGGPTDDAYETTFTITNPSGNDKTITFPNLSGTVSLFGSAVDSSEITDGTIVNADIADNTITGAKLTNDITITGDITVGGNDIKPNDGGAGGAAIQFNNGNVIIRLGQ